MAGELRATVLTTVKGEAVKKLQKDLEGLGGGLKGLTGVAGKAMKAFAGLAATLGAQQFVSGSIEQAKNLERSLLGLNTVFGDLSPQVEAFTKSADEFGLSQSEAAKASVFLGSVLQQYGVSSSDAAIQTEKLTKLAADLAATYGYDVQEALLAMTALFRGEYDPIEKFGVAMKQNEIESVKAARGLEKLTGQAEMNADAQIRLELLYQRTGKAQGAMERGAGTLYVQQEKLRATFENFQAQLGAELIPVLVQLFDALKPMIENSLPAFREVFQGIGDTMEVVVGVIKDLFDPTTALGDAALGASIALSNLFRTLTGFSDKNTTMVGVKNFFTLLAGAIQFLADVINALLVSLQFLLDSLGALLSLDFNRLFDAARMEKYGDAFLGSASKVNQFTKQQIISAQAFRYWIQERDKAVDGALSMGTQKEIWNVLSEPLPKIDPPLPDPDDTRNAVKDFWQNLTDDIERQAARTRLLSMGASEGLIGAILGASGDWKKVFQSIVKGGMKAVENAQAIFNKTSGGIKEIEEGAKKALEALDKMRDADIERAKQLTGSGAEVESYYSAFSRMLEAGYEREIAMQVAREEYAEALARRNAELIRQQQEIRDAFNKTSAEIFQSFESAGITRQMGEYASAVATLREELVALIEENVFEGRTGLFSRDAQTKLISSLNNVADLMMVVADARDRIANDIADAQDELTGLTGEKKSLFQSIVDSIMGGVNVTQLGSSSRTIIRSLTRTLEQTRAFAQQIDQLRTMGLGESAIRQIIDAGAEVGGKTAKALLKGGAAGISEVNRLYSDINAVATGIGEKTSSLMFDSGVKATQALLDGLLKQESEFVQAAEYLADAFRRSFDAAITTGQVSITTPSFESIMDAVNTQSVIGAARFAQPTFGMGNPTNITVNINPGVVTDPVGLGREVVNAIQRYEQNNGKVFVRTR